ncbi:MAG: SiaB family protein kinase [Bacteroidales bacterium]
MAVNQEILSYKGFFNYTIVNQLLKQLTEFEQSEKMDLLAFKKIQIVMVEMLENSYSYTSNFAKEFPYDNFFPEFKILRSDERFRLISSNPIEKADVDELKIHLERINRSSLKDLRAWYKEILMEGMNSKKSSAGIGLIRIAKVIRNKFKYSFHKIDNKFLYYTLEISINTK